MPDIQTLLRDYGEHLEDVAPIITVEELEQVVVGPARPAPWWQRPTMVVVSAAVIVVLVIGGLSFLFGGDREPASSTVSSSSTVASTVPPTTAASTPPTTAASLLLPPPPALGDQVELHPDEELLAGVWIEAAVSLGLSDLSVHLSEYQDLGMFSSVPGSPNELFAFTTPEDASDYMSARMSEELGEELNPIASGEESLSYVGSFGRGGQATVHLIRVGRLVFVALESDDNLDSEEVASVVAAMESSFRPSLTAFHGSVAILEPLQPDEQALGYGFEAWPMRLGELEGGDRQAISFGYDRDGQGSCTHWTGDFEPLAYTTYTPTDDGVSVTRNAVGESQEVTTIPATDSEYVAADSACDRFPPLAGQWGLGSFVNESTPDFDDKFNVYQVGVDEFMLVAPQVGFSIVEDIPFVSPTRVEVPPDISVIGSNIRVDGVGYVSIEIEFQGPRGSLEEFLEIDLSAMPDETIGVWFGFVSFVGDDDWLSDLPRLPRPALP